MRARAGQRNDKNYDSKRVKMNCVPIQRDLERQGEHEKELVREVDLP